jgi:PAS domain S-box-containing protein
LLRRRWPSCKETQCWTVKLAGRELAGCFVNAPKRVLTMPKQLEDYLRTTLASIGDAVISTDVEGRILFVNKVALSLLRTTAANVAGKPIDEIFHIQNEFTRETVENPVAKLLLDGVTDDLPDHTVLVAQDGTEIPIDLSIAAIRDEDGVLQGAVLVFRDITARRKAELTQRLLAAIVESSDDAIISKDVNGIVTSWNKAAERIFGYSAAEMIGKPINVIAAPDRIDEMPAILERIKRGERIDHYETVRKAEDGRLVTVSLTVSPIYDEYKRIIGASKIARDITEQIRTRLELAEEKEWLRVTLSSIGDGVITTDGAGRVAYLNPVAEQLTGWQTSEASGRALEEVFTIINEDSRLTVENPATKVLREGVIAGLANHTLLITREGHERSIDDSGAPIRVNSGEIRGVVLVFRDVTDRRAEERERQAQALELRRANEELTHFAYAVAHDLREPLRTIATFSELLHRSFKNGSQAGIETAIHHIVAGTQRMQTLLNDLLAYSRAGGSQESAVLVDTNAALSLALDNLKAAIAESGATITSDSLPPVPGHSAHIVEVFQNLVGNAIKYRSESAPHVQICAQKNDHEWIFSVRDNGEGIRPEHREKIFRPFTRLHGGDIPGTGMGLAICSKIIERYGGRMWVTSQPGEGSEFFFSLPEAAS